VPTLLHIDAFAERLFTGNPAGVCLLDEPAGEEFMQSLAAELNLPETAFVHPEGDDRYGLRWFAPLREIGLCGHATLASAHALWQEGRLAPSAPARFRSAGGPLEARLLDGGVIELDFPLVPVQPAEPSDELRAILEGADIVAVSTAGPNLMVELRSETVVRDLRPDLVRLAALPVQGVVVTARGDRSEFDFVSRYFAPAVGIPEDPVTGSAHCALGPYWAAQLGRTELRARQLSARGGVVGVSVAGDRVLLRGTAVTVLSAPLTVAI
jgi:predicted PhzF superfamily epimerase YddE/YHI9